MTFYYLDTSAWAKCYYREKGSAWMTGLSARTTNMTCASLGLVELIASAARKVKAGDISASDFGEMIRKARANWKRFLRIHLTREVIDIAIEVAAKWALRGSDAIHLASARRLRQKLAGGEYLIVLVTSDRELRVAAKGEGFETIDPEEAERSGTPP